MVVCIQQMAQDREGQQGPTSSDQHQEEEKKEDKN